VTGQRRDLRQKYPSADKMALDRYLLWVTCQAISNDRTRGEASGSISIPSSTACRTNRSIKWPLPPNSHVFILSVAPPYMTDQPVGPIVTAAET
jgi:hypothetical protein